MRILKPGRLRKLLHEVIDDYFGSVSAAGDYAGIPQSTLWQILDGREVITHRTRTRLRSLLRDMPDSDWDVLFFTPEKQRQLREYEDCLRSELSMHSTGFGLASEDDPTADLGQAADQELRRFEKWALAKGHHPERVRLAVCRIRQPFNLGELGAIGEAPGDMTDDKILKIVQVGIKREKLLMSQTPLLMMVAPSP